MRTPPLFRTVLALGVGALFLTAGLAVAQEDGGKSEVKDAVDKILERNAVDEPNGDGQEAPVSAPARERPRVTRS